MIGSGDYAGNDAGSAALGAGQLGPLGEVVQIN